MIEEIVEMPRCYWEVLKKGPRVEEHTEAYATEW